jgi:hypothetical protein
MARDRNAATSPSRSALICRHSWSNGTYVRTRPQRSHVPRHTPASRAPRTELCRGTCSWTYAYGVWPSLQLSHTSRGVASERQLGGAVLILR